MSSSITTRVGWGAQSTFGEGPSSGPGLVLGRRLRVEEARWMRLKGSRHKCSGSGGLERKQEDQRGSGGLLRTLRPAMLTWSVRATQPLGVARQAAGCRQSPAGRCGAVCRGSLPGTPGEPD